MALLKAVEVRWKIVDPYDVGNPADPPVRRVYIFRAPRTVSFIVGDELSKDTIIRK